MPIVTADETPTVPARPWDLRAFPNFESARRVDQVDAEDLSEAAFHRDYVARNRPCLLKRVIAKWPALSLWSSSAYLAEKVGHRLCASRTRPRVEAFGLRPPAADERARRLDAAGMQSPVTFRELFRRLETPNADILIAEEDGGSAILSAISGDVGLAPQKPFAVLTNPPRPQLIYTPWAVMFYKNSYSDWHFHPGAEAIMSQVKGSKDVLLLPPNLESWRQVAPVHIGQMKVYDVDRETYPRFFEARPYHVVVEEGDGLFIPVHWWHAVQARSPRFGITVPYWWQSRYLDLRQPATRHFLSYLWKHLSRRLAAALAVQCVGATARIRVREWGSRSENS
jgi:hypothetical protein